MPFGLCNAPATFSRAISLVLKGLAWTSVIVFLDDIVVLSKDFDSHITNLTSVMDRLEQYGMKLKPKKCQLLKSSVIFLGKCVSSEGVQVPTHDIDRVVNWTRPACKRDVQSFIGVMNFHRDHIPSFATIAKPLYDVMSPKSTFEWTADQQQAFDLLKRKMTTAPVLAYPNPDDLFILDTDASNHAIGAELLQVQNGTERLIGFGSFVFDPAQRKYCTTRKELLAVVRFTRHFKHYLLGRRFVVRTDHNSLTWLMGFRNIEGQGWPVAFTGGICHRYLPVNTGMDNTPKSGVYRHLLAFINILLISLQITLLTVLATYYIIHGHHSTIFAAYA